MEGPSDKRGGERQPVGLLVRLAYGTVDEFVERFAVNMSRGGLFIRTRDPRPVGTALNLEIRLGTGEAVIRAQGVVRWVQAPEAASHARPPLAPGMGIQFTQLDEASQAVVDRMVSLREKRGLAPGARPRFSRSETMRSTTALEASSSWVNWTPIPGARGGRAGDSASGSGAWTQRTTPIALITDSPFWRRISRLRTVPTGRGSRVRMKRPPRDMLTAKRSTNSSTLP